MIEHIILTVTSRCNARCKMCHMWQRNDRDIPLEKIKEIIDSSSVKNTLINMVPTGGEPTLREDLPEIFGYAFENLRNLRYTGFFTNSLLPHKAHEIAEKAIDLLAKYGRKDVSFSVGLSLDGYGKVHDDIRGIKGAFAKVMENYLGLKVLSKKKRFYIGFNFVVQKENLAGGNALYMLDVAEQALLPILFPIVYGKDIFYNMDNAGDWVVGEDMLKDAVGFYAKAAERAQKGKLLVDNGIYYREVLGQLRGFPRTMPCLFREKKACVVDADGSVYLCDLTRESLLGNIYEKSFDEIWNSPQKDVAYQNMIAYCDRCFSNCAVGSGRYQLREVWNSKGLPGIIDLSYTEARKRIYRLKKLIDEYKYVIWPRL
jgi:radical SAM protein with 4Fe4S-binding SPASM domain